MWDRTPYSQVSHFGVFGVCSHTHSRSILSNPAVTSKATHHPSRVWETSLCGLLQLTTTLRREVDEILVLPVLAMNPRWKDQSCVLKLLSGFGPSMRTEHASLAGDREPNTVLSSDPEILLILGSGRRPGRLRIRTHLDIGLFTVYNSQCSSHFSIRPYQSQNSRYHQTLRF